MLKIKLTKEEVRKFYIGTLLGIIFYFLAIVTIILFFIEIGVN